ncbi:MAG: hypothetical protein AB7P42_09475 [Gammaproteobacteria bacterium]
MGTSDDRSKHVRDPRMRESLADAYLYIQKKYEDEGRIPRDSGNVLSSHQALWETLGAIHLGMFVAAVSVVMSFILINFLLHLPPS